MVIVTTTFTIARSGDGEDPYEAATSSTLASGVPGHLSAPTGLAQNVGGVQTVVDAVAYLPTGTGVEAGDILTDNGTGLTYMAVWSQARHGLGLDHDVVGVRDVRGGSDG